MLQRGISLIAIATTAITLGGCLASNRSSPDITPTSGPASTTTHSNSTSTSATSSASNPTSSSTNKAKSNTILANSNSSNSNTTSTNTNTSTNSALSTQTTSSSSGNSSTGNNYLSNGTSSTGNTKKSVHLVGLGYYTETDNKGYLLPLIKRNVKGVLEIEPAFKNKIVVPSKIIIDNQEFKENCGVENKNEYSCVNPDIDSRGTIIKLKDKGYQYLHVMKWNKLPDETPKAVYVGGEEKYRTKPDAYIYGTYSGTAKIGGTFNKNYEGKVTLYIHKKIVAGNISGFKDSAGNNINGKINILGAVVRNEMHASIDGEFDNHKIDLSRSLMSGAFFGPNGEEVGGGIAGKTRKGETFNGYWTAKK